MNASHNTFILDVDALLSQQLADVSQWHATPHAPSEPGDLTHRTVLLNHFNFALWHQEDLARDPHATDSLIATVKRAIDKLNQQRNDMIEKVDEALIIHFSKVKPQPSARLNSETPGSMVDRLSINALKIYHMEEETNRETASPEHRAKCAERLSILRAQRSDLGNCLKEILNDLQQGTKFMKVYRQMKMYNDPTLNPVLYRQSTK
jgi:hypothetical protein